MSQKHYTAELNESSGKCRTELRSQQLDEHTSLNVNLWGFFHLCPRGTKIGMVLCHRVKPYNGTKYMVIVLFVSRRYQISFCVHFRCPQSIVKDGSQRIEFR